MTPHHVTLSVHLFSAFAFSSLFNSLKAILIYHCVIWELVVIKTRRKELLIAKGPYQVKSGLSGEL